MKQSLMMIAFCFALSNVSAQTCRIQEHGINPNCDGRYALIQNGFRYFTPGFYSYPTNIDRTIGPPCINPVPDSIEFNIPNCTPSTFFVQLNGIVKSISCNCSGTGYFFHNYYATINPDPLNLCDFIIDIFY